MNWGRKTSMEELVERWRQQREVTERTRHHRGHEERKWRCFRTAWGEGAYHETKRERERGLREREWGGGVHNNSSNPSEIILQWGPSSLTTRLWFCRVQTTSDYFSTLRILPHRDRIRAERTALIGLLPCRISSAPGTEKWGRGYITLYVDL